MLLEVGEPRALGRDHPRVDFGEEPKTEGSWAGRRSLQIEGVPAFELSYWCGTCQFLFRRLEGANAKVSLAELESVLNDGLDRIDDDVLTTFGGLLANGAYIPLLLEVAPRLQLPGRDGDYFAEEQIQTWGLEPFWGLPEYPRTPYYRTFETPAAADAHLYEFVVPMVPPSWNDAATVSRHAEALARSSKPTAVAVSTLDVCAPAVTGTAAGLVDIPCVGFAHRRGWMPCPRSTHRSSRLMLRGLLAAGT